MSASHTKHHRIAADYGALDKRRKSPATVVERPSDRTTTMTLRSRWQPAVVAPVPNVARGLVFDLKNGADPRSSLTRLQRDLGIVDQSVVGIGLPLMTALSAKVDGLRSFPPLEGKGCSFPSTQGALWAFVGATGESELHDATCSIVDSLGDGFVLREEVSTFRYREGRDLTGYLDGTANPVDVAAIKAAIVSGKGEGLDGSTFVAVQRWVHDLPTFRALTPHDRDLTFGRRLDGNEEIKEAPATAHVKRAEQEDYEPNAFMLRRSMPWGGARDNGIYFVAYGCTLDAFERVLTRMSGKEDGVVDSLLTFSRAISGGYYWCPPTLDGHIDWRAVI